MVLDFLVSIDRHCLRLSQLTLFREAGFQGDHESHLGAVGQVSVRRSGWSFVCFAWVAERTPEMYAFQQRDFLDTQIQ